MFYLGKYNTLKVVKAVDFGFYLDIGEDEDNILLPKRYAPPGLDVDQKLRVFIYRDSEDRLIATTETPKAIIGDTAFLKVKDVNDNGAFLDWGLSKDLFVPFREQVEAMEVGESYLVHLYLDKSDRISASAKLNKFISPIAEGYQENDEVDLLVDNQTDLGWKVIVDQTSWGVIYEDDATMNLKYGMELKGFVKNVREDQKLDISLQKIGFSKVGDLKEKILQKLKDNNGKIALHDKSSPDAIKELLGMSKKSFKQAIGGLYKDQKIVLNEKSIELK